MKEGLQKLQKLRILVSFYRNQVYFFSYGQTLEEQLGFGVEKRCEFSRNSIDPVQRELVSILLDDNLPLPKRLMSIASRLQVLLEELIDGASDEERKCYQGLTESLYIDICEMQCLLNDFVSENKN